MKQIIELNILRLTILRNCVSNIFSKADQFKSKSWLNPITILLNYIILYMFEDRDLLTNIAKLFNKLIN